MCSPAAPARAADRPEVIRIGGILLMLEVTAPQRWFDLTVGITEGWWSFSDHDLRPDYATMPRERWLRLLPECGFDASTALPAGGPLSGSLALQSLIVARAARQARRDWWLVGDAGGIVAQRERVEAVEDQPQRRVVGAQLRLSLPEMERWVKGWVRNNWRNSANSR